MTSSCNADGGEPGAGARLTPARAAMLHEDALAGIHRFSSAVVLELLAEIDALRAELASEIRRDACAKLTSVKRRLPDPDAIERARQAARETRVKAGLPAEAPEHAEYERLTAERRRKRAKKST
jgi:hypothetical protein